MKLNFPRSPIARDSYGNGLLSNNRKGIILMLVSCALLTFGDAVTKLLTENFPVGQVIFIRSLITGALIIVIFAARNKLFELIPVNFRGQLLRAALFALATFLFVWSLSLLPLPVVSSVMFTGPILAMVLASPVLGERVGWRLMLVVLFGFLGVLLIVDPVGQRWQWIILIPLCAALAGASRDLLTRRLTGTETTISILFTAMLLTSLVSLVTVPQGWASLSSEALILFAVAGTSQGLAFFLQISAFRHGEASAVSPFRYSIILWSVLLGYLVWGYVPPSNVLLGALIVIVAGVVVFLERRDG